jgi:hypothetical protein
MSAELARQCCNTFDTTIKKVYQGEYLRLPTDNDVKAIFNLHHSIHGIKGMFGSLDCSHTYWKNCPKAWQGSFKGKEQKPSVVLEAIADHHLWFWHASYGYAGTLNDLNILNLSPFLDSLIDGSFETKERLVVPFNINNRTFDKMFLLCDGIYPPYSRFVRTIPLPISQQEKYFAGWQESARKDIERAFGVLQSKFQFMCRPIMLHKPGAIANRVATAMILHNMCVSDRIMDGNVYAVYNADYSLEIDTEGMETVQQPDDLQQIQDQHYIDPGHGRSTRQYAAVGPRPQIGVGGMSNMERWKELGNVEEHNRLTLAIMAEVGKMDR